MGRLDAVQQEQLSAIGTYLSQVRQEQERSLEDIAAKTYIPLRLLRAIESGQGQPLPEPVFVQGFIRRYADALGLDGMDLSQRFPVHVTPLPIATAVAPVPEPARSYSEASYASPATPAAWEDEPARSPSRRAPRSYLPYVAAAGLLGFAGIALGIVHQISSRPPRPSPSTVLPQQPAPPSPAASSPSPASPANIATTTPQSVSRSAGSNAAPASPGPVSNSASSPAPSPARAAATAGSPQARSSDPVRAEMQLSGESWVRVTVDGVVKAEATLPKGTRQSWSGKQEIVIESGNAGAVAVSANGAAAKPMGELGAVEELTVRPQAGSSGSGSSGSASP